jgi:4-hydroxythreonine-4-phosphate dehydrogenase
MAKSVKIGITIGDKNGIGPEVILKALKDPRILSGITPVVYGCENVLNHFKKTLGFEQLKFERILSADNAQPNKINVINVLTDESLVKEGVEEESSGTLAIKSIEAASTDISSGKIDAIVTAPISKSVCQNAGFDFPGHTEFFISLSNGAEGIMILTSSLMKIALVTTHVPLKDVSSIISKEMIVSKTEVFHQSLQKDFGILNPKIAILSLNPHSGENGKIGTEEIEVQIPAISELKTKNILAFGPFPTDGFFGSSAPSNYDGVLAMYHDQGLSVFKALSFDEGVNYTAGLPIVRTSPDHGTAFDIAGKNKASETSMRNALYSAADIFTNRIEHKIIHADPLPVKKKRKSRQLALKTKGFQKKLIHLPSHFSNTSA